MYEEQYHVQANRLMKILDGNKYEFNKLKKKQLQYSDVIYISQNNNRYILYKYT